MLKRLFSVILVSLFVVGVGISFADSPEGKNIVDLFGRGGPTGITPPTEVIKVRYGYVGEDTRSQAGLSSGDVVCWDCNSGDGYTISGCIVENSLSFAGVLVEDIGTTDNSAIRGTGNNIGYIAVGGFVFAKIDTSSSTEGHRVITAADDGTGVDTAFITENNIAAATAKTVTNDVGVLLDDSASDSILSAVWLD